MCQALKYFQSVQLAVIVVIVHQEKLHFAVCFLQRKIEIEKEQRYVGNQERGARVKWYQVCLGGRNRKSGPVSGPLWIFLNPQSFRCEFKEKNYVYTTLYSKRIQKNPHWGAYSKSCGFFTEFVGYVWTEAVSATEKLRIQKCPDTSGRDLKRPLEFPRRLLQPTNVVPCYRIYCFETSVFSRGRVAEENQRKEWIPCEHNTTNLHAA